MRDFATPARRHQYAYDGSGNLVSYKNPLAVAGSQNPVTYTYYGTAPLAHVLASYTLPRGNGMKFEYYVNGKVFRHCRFETAIPAACTDPTKTTTFSYNEFRRETVAVNERGHPRRFFFDVRGNPVMIREENGGERHYTYDPATPMNRTSKQDPMGSVTGYTYDGNGNVTRITLPSGNTIDFSYFTAYNQPGKLKDARGHYTLLTYDSHGNLLQEIRLRAGVGAATDPTTYTVNAADVVAWTIHTYDGYGNRLTRKQVREAATQVGPTIEYTYDTPHLAPVSITRRGDKDGDGDIEASEYDTATLAYDALGRLTTGLREDWYATQLVYDAVDRVIQGTDAVGQLRDYGFDANGNPTSESLTVSGSVVDQRTATYDLADRKATSTTAGGYTTRYQYDAAGNVTRVTNPDGYTLTFVYDPNNQVLEAADQEGNTVRRTLDLDGKPRTITDPNGSTTSFTSYGPEREGRLQSRADPLGHTTTYDYDPNGNVIAVTDPLGRTALTTYDELNRPTRVVGPIYLDPLFGEVRPVRRTTYNLLGHLVAVDAGYTAVNGTNPAQDVLWRQATYVCDDFGRRLRTTDPLGRTWTAAYDIYGNPLTVTDPRGQVTTSTYAYGHLLQTRTATTETVPLTEGVQAWPDGYQGVYPGLICVAPAGPCTGSDLRLGAGLTGPPLGYLKRTEAPGTTVPVSGSVCYGNPWADCDSRGVTAGAAGPALGHAATSPPPGGSLALVDSGGILYQGLAGTPTRYLWTNLAATRTDHLYVTAEPLAPGYENATVVGHLRPNPEPDTLALSRFQDPATGGHFYTTRSDVPTGVAPDGVLGYVDATDPGGLLPLARHSNAMTKDYRLTTSTTPPDGYTYQGPPLGYVRSAASALGAIAFTYTPNARGQVTQATSPEVTYTYTYDPAHRLQTVTDSRGGTTLTYSYSPGGQRTRLQTSEGAITSYGYDPVGRLTSLWAPDGGSVTLGYDPGGRLLEQRLPNGAVTRPTWNADGTLAQRLTQVGSTPVSQHDYPYDAAGNRVTHIEQIGATTTPYGYTYDPLGRLVTVTDTATNTVLEASTYDVLGNRLSQTAGGTTWTYLYDAQHQELRELRQNGVPATTLGYDAAGNLAWRQDGTVLTTYGYDPFNRLATVTDTNTVLQTYGYDDQDRRIRTTADTTSTYFLYDGADILAEYSSWGTPLARYTHGAGIDQPLLRTTATGTQYYHADELGSIVAVTSPTGGIDATTRYDPWGNVVGGTGTIPRYGYTGREPDETGLVYYRARYYDPSIGRFTQRDPIGLAGGINPYAYVDNSPTNFTDPYGESGIYGAAVGVVSGGVGGIITGYATGGMRGVLIGGVSGAVAGGIVGFLNPYSSYSAGAAAGGAVTSLVGQFVGNVATQTALGQLIRPGANLSLMAAAGAGIGAGLASPVVTIAGGAARVATGLPVQIEGTTTGILVTTSARVAGGLAEGAVEGLVVGSLEYAGARVGTYLTNSPDTAPRGSQPMPDILRGGLEGGLPMAPVEYQPVPDILRDNWSATSDPSPYTAGGTGVSRNK